MFYNWKFEVLGFFIIENSCSCMWWGSFEGFLFYNWIHPVYFHSFNFGLCWVYKYTHYLVEPGAQKGMAVSKWHVQYYRDRERLKKKWNRQYRKNTLWHKSLGTACKLTLGYKLSSRYWISVEPRDFHGCSLPQRSVENTLQT